MTEIMFYDQNVVCCDFGYIYMKCDHSETKLAASTECAAPLSHSLKYTDTDIGVLVAENPLYLWVSTGKSCKLFFSNNCSKNG